MDSSNEELASAIFWLSVCGVAGIVTAIIAHKKGLSSWLWLSCLFCWPFGLVIALAIPANKKVLEERALRSGDSKQCPSCAEIIRAEANICPRCRQRLGAAAVATEATNNLMCNCPSCSKNCLITSEQLGEELICPFCSQTFHAERGIN